MFSNFVALIKKPYAADILTILLLVIILFLLGRYVPFEKSVIPTTSGQQNLNFAYPIRLLGNIFYPNDIDECLFNPQASGCGVIYDKNIVPYEEVRSLVEVAILVVGSAVVILFHSLGAALYIAKRPEYEKILHIETTATISSSIYELITSQLVRWLVSEGLLGLLFSVGLESAIVYLLKEKLSTPRPIYYALQKWSSVYPVDRQGFLAQASRSFPSGHSGSAAAVFGYCIILLVHDSKSWCRASACQMRISWLAIWVMLIFIFYVGATRIKDYWHFSGDVVGKFKSQLY